MKIAVLTALSALGLAGCMPTMDEAQQASAASVVATDEAAATPDLGKPVGLRADVPLPPKRPDFEFVTPASRALGAVVADAARVDAALEAHADIPKGPPPAVALHEPPPPAAPPPPPPVAALPPSGAALPSFASRPGPLGPDEHFTPAPGQATAAAPAPAIPASRTAAFAPGYYAAYEDTEVSCFPPQLRAALDTIAAHYGKPVEVTSGFRDHGRSHSMHRYCMAADIRVDGVGPRELAAYVKTVDNINGVGTYRYNTVTHIDVRANKMAWRY